MDKKIWKDTAVAAAALAIIAGGVTAALAGTNALTAGTIAARNEEAENQARLQVIDADDFEKRTLAGDEGEEVVYYEALRDGETVGYVFTVSTTGKSAGLTVMTGISADGKITGVTVTDDNETAGYVDKVKDGGLFEGFQDKAVPDGGFVLGEDVDGVSQATKTSRGVTDGVNRAAAYYRQIQKEAE